MEDCHGSVTCNVRIETYEGPSGSQPQSEGHQCASYRGVELSLWRNEFKEILLCIAKKGPLKKFVLYDVKFHCKFMKEGKSTITIANQNVRLLLSNAPPQPLKEFFKLLSVKLTHFKSKTQMTDRQKLTSGLSKAEEEISPLNEADMAAVNSSRQQPGKIAPEAAAKKRKLPFADRTNQLARAPQPSKKPLLVLNKNALNKEQKHVLGVVRSGKNIFFTGSAGTGKTFLLRHVIGMLPPKQTVVTASTGIAACHIGGITLHSFAGVGRGAHTLQQCAALMRKQPAVAKRWRACSHLIVDEVSMVSSAFFDKLEAIARMLRGNDEPFGGIQLILCGDFFQLPPVCKDKDEAEKRMCFQGSAWRKCALYTWELKKVYRQQDPAFVRVLQDIRIGRCDAHIADTLRATRHHKLERDDIVATRLCTHREDVDRMNEERLSKLSGEEAVFRAVDSSDAYTVLLDRLLPDTWEIKLKVGAQVMLTKNLDAGAGLVNGARGVVVRFKPAPDQTPVVRFVSTREHEIGPERWTVKLGADVTGVRRQVPLKLAWAISIHKSQGMSIDRVEMSLSRVFECGQAYVALSRARSLQGLRVLDFDSSCVRSDVEVLRFYRRLRQRQACDVMAL